MAEFGQKGRGVRTTRPFQKGEVVCRYDGDLIPHRQAIVREAKYANQQDSGCYMFYFKWRESLMWSVKHKQP